VLPAGAAADAPACGRIAYEAFKSVCERHGFPPRALWRLPIGPTPTHERLAQLDETA